MNHSDFEYNDLKFRHVERHNDRCYGCYFWENNISCTPKVIPECKTGTFVEIKEN